MADEVWERLRAAQEIGDHAPELGGQGRGSNLRPPLFRRIRGVAVCGWMWPEGPASCNNYGWLSPDVAWRLLALAPRLAPLNRPESAESCGLARRAAARHAVAPGPAVFRPGSPGSVTDHG
jgi:hypothetical protein